MSITTRLLSASLRLLFLPVAVLSGFATTSATAQTLPQLLPYTAKLIAGSGTATIASGATCPASGLTSTDAYGDGCLAIEISLTAPRGAVADAGGNVFFTDYTNGLVRRVDALTGVVTAVAGGASASPAANAACGSLSSTDARGDGCLSTAVKLSHPAGLAFSPAGDLYFSDIGYVNVRKIAATNGVITTGGVISLVAGNAAGSFGYASGVAANTGYLQDPYGLSFDSAGNLYIADEYTHAEAVLVVNTNASGSTTVTGVTIPAGQIVKIIGSTGSGSAVCPNTTATVSSNFSGCSYGSFTNGAVANLSQVDGPYAVTSDPNGNVYFSNEFNDNIGKVSAAGLISNYAGIQGSVAKGILTRGAAGSFAVGSSFGITSDPLSNVYFTDASSGLVWRVDGAGALMYPVAGGASTVCSAATDTYGDGCPALQARFGSSGTTFASTTAPGPGIYGVSVDANANLYTADTETNLIREISSGTQFGTVGLNQPTQTLDIHFAVGDQPGTYTLASAGSSNFTLGTPACTANSDGTKDCLLPVTATPTTLGAFSGTLQVVSTLGAKSSFPLSGTYVKTPATRTAVALSNASGCTGTNVYSISTPLTLTATITAGGSVTGMVTFFANGAALGTPQMVSNNAASLTYTFATPGTYAITAKYSGDTYFQTSTGTVASPITSSTPTFSMGTVTNGQSTVSAGQTALYSFLLNQSVYTGTISLACSGLPSYSTCTFSPATIVATGCSTMTTVALSINTQQSPPVIPASFAFTGRGGRTLLGIVPGVLLALMIQIRRRRLTPQIRPDLDGACAADDRRRRDGLRQQHHRPTDPIRNLYRHGHRHRLGRHGGHLHRAAGRKVAAPATLFALLSGSPPHTGLYRFAPP